MKNLLLGASVLLLASATAHAQTTVLIDDFNTDQAPVSDTTTGNGPEESGPVSVVVDGNTIDRTISIDLLDFLDPPEAEIEIAGGVLDLNLGVGDDAEGRLLYNIDSLSDDFDDLGTLTDLALVVEVVAADGTFKTIEAILNGTSLGEFALPDLVEVGSPQTLSFDIDPTSDIGGDLEFVLNGEPGYDIAFNFFAFATTAEQVPAPAALALFGMGLVGLGLARRRRA